MATTVTLRWCFSCTPTANADAVHGLEQALAGAGVAHRVRVTPQTCFGACATPVSFSLQARGRATYLFSGVDPVTDQSDIVATVLAYLDAPDGWIADARPCGRLRHCLVGRVPAPDDTGSPDA